MKTKLLIATILYLAIGSQQFLSAQTQLDSVRSETLLTIFDQITTPFVFASRSFLKSHDRWPSNIEELTLYVREHDDSLITRRFNSIFISVKEDNDLLMSYQMKPFRLRLRPEDQPSLVLNLAGRVSLSPPIGGDSFISTLIVYVDSSAVAMEDSSLSVATGLSTIMAKIIRPEY